MSNTKASRNYPSQEHLIELFTYDPESGCLFWNSRPENWFKTEQRNSSANCAAWNARYAGIRAGCVRVRASNGRKDIVVTIDGRSYLASRIIWKIKTGQEPPEVDHRDNDPLNNRWVNLRAASTAQNNQNKGMASANTSGFKGVYFDADRGKWRAQVKANGRSYNAGRFDTPEAAAAAARVKRDELHREFANHG